ncbi:MAG: TROVE domain-containing protein [Candidatus Aenigmatarchaeota archaeon]|nr:MAG: TROVE domain-containing protein [Candidatus Aenigmarchaeota archaeon]
MKLNRTLRGSTATTNYEGAKAYKMNDKSRLYTRTASCFFGEPKFYGNQDNELIKDAHAVAKKDPEFVLKLAAYARNKLNLRTVSIVLLTEASLINECKPFVREYTPLIVKRADELAEAVAYLEHKVGDLGDQRDEGSMPSALKRGLADAFHNFDEYQLAKYDRDNAKVKLRDVMRLTHPKPKDEAQSALFKKVVDRSLETPSTWETIVSGKGSTPEAWKKAMRVMPYMATLRNLRNLLKQGFDITGALNRISDPENVRKSKQLPFRFFSAYRQIEGMDSNAQASETLDALEEAMDVSVENLPKLPGTTAIFIDSSGSMTSSLSSRSSLSYADAAIMLGVIAHRVCEKSLVYMFDSELRSVNLSKRSGVLSNVRKLSDMVHGGATYGHLCFEELIKKNKVVDRIILLSDMQCYTDGMWGSEIAPAYREYKKQVAPECQLYSVDLSGYGTLQVPEQNTALIAGFSEKFLNFVKLWETEGVSAVEAIGSKAKCASCELKDTCKKPRALAKEVKKK